MLRVTDGPARLQAAIAAVQLLPRDVRKGLRDETRALVVPAMRSAALSHARTPVQQRLAGTARLSVWRDVPGVAFGGARAVTGDGTPGRVLARASEYGSPGTRQVRLRVHSPKGTTYSVTRHTTRQWRPVDHSGKWVTRAALDVAPDVVDAWVQLVERETLAAFGGE